MFSLFLNSLEQFLLLKVKNSKQLTQYNLLLLNFIHRHVCLMTGVAMTSLGNVTAVSDEGNTYTLEKEAKETQYDTD